MRVELAEHLQGLDGRERAAAREGVAEVLAAEEFHDDPGDALVVDAGREHLHDVVALDAGAGAACLADIAERVGHLVQSGALGDAFAFDTASPETIETPSF